MKISYSGLLVAALPVALALGLTAVPGLSAAAAEPTDAPGKGIFLAQKCNLCHSIAAADIVKTTKSEKLAGPDLDGVGSRHEEAWMTAYLLKKEAMEGKNHPKEVKASEADLAALVGWLGSLKEAPAP